MLRYSRAGLILRAVGENHHAAHALGYKVVRVRILAILFGGVRVLQLNLQAAGVDIAVEYLSMSPYLITILALVLLSARRTRLAWPCFPQCALRSDDRDDRADPNDTTQVLEEPVK